MPTDFLSVLHEFQSSNVRCVLMHPLDARQFADPAVRERWQTESGMIVLSFKDPQNRRPTVDLFAQYPMDFEALYRDSLLLTLKTTVVRLASVEHLIQIKTGRRPADGSRRRGSFGRITQEA